MNRTQKMDNNNYLNRTSFKKSLKLKTQQQQKTIAFATGGTGGHIFPAVSLAVILGQKHRLLWCLDERGLTWLHAQKATPSSNAKPDKITAEVVADGADILYKNKIVLQLKYGFMRNLRQKIAFVARLALNFIKATYYLISYKVDIVIGFGGYASAPTLLAAWLLRKPIVLCEPNSVLGKVNRLFLPAAKSLFCGFPNPRGIANKYQAKVEFTGIPIRMSQHNSAGGFGDSNLNTKGVYNENNYKILVIGGSQGASVFQRLIPEALKHLSPAIATKIVLMQQITAETDPELTKQLVELKLHSFEIAKFFPDIYEKIQAADIIIARSGASTIAEIVQFAKPAILIPLPNSADQHQLYNAEYLANADAALIFDEQRDTADDLGAMIKKLMAKADRKELINNLKKLQKPNAAAEIAVKLNKLLLE